MPKDNDKNQEQNLFQPYQPQPGEKPFWQMPPEWAQEYPGSRFPQQPLWRTVPGLAGTPMYPNWPYPPRGPKPIDVDKSGKLLNDEEKKKQQGIMQNNSQPNYLYNPTGSALVEYMAKLRQYWLNQLGQLMIYYNQVGKRVSDRNRPGISNKQDR